MRRYWRREEDGTYGTNNALQKFQYTIKFCSSLFAYSDILYLFILQSFFTILFVTRNVQNGKDMSALPLKVICYEFVIFIGEIVTSSMTETVVKCEEQSLICHLNMCVQI